MPVDLKETLEPGFDYVVVTASTPRQADQYRKLVQKRVDAKLYPSSLQFRVYHDPPAGRVGSGGGTLLALVELIRDEVLFASGNRDADLELEAALSFVSSKRILILHAGGESRRLPCYVPEGKLFAPVNLPEEVCNSQCPPVILDILLQLYFKYPWKLGEVIMASGDVIVDFDTTTLHTAQQSDLFKRGAICGFSKPTSFAQGRNHGVFAFGSAFQEPGVPTLAVSDFHQKSSPEVLERDCQIPGCQQQCAVDTGLFSLAPAWVRSFLEFALLQRPMHDAEPHQGPGFTFLKAVEKSQIYFDFYLECVMASIPGQSVGQYLARMRSSGSKMTDLDLQTVHACFSGLELRCYHAQDAVFLHFGTMKEYPDSSKLAVQRSMWPIYVDPTCTKALSVTADEQDGNSIFKVNCSKSGNGVIIERLGNPVNASSLTWVESCSDCVITLSSAGFNMVVGAHKLHVELPDTICIDGRQWKDAEGTDHYCSAVYASNDTFKQEKAPEGVRFCGTSMSQWLETRGLPSSDVWETGPLAGLDLWSAKLFCERGDIEYNTYSDKLRGYWDRSAFDTNWFQKSHRFSLKELNELDSALERDDLRMYFRS